MSKDKPTASGETRNDEKILVSIYDVFDKIQTPLKQPAKNVFTEIDKIHYLPQVSKIDLVQVNAESFDGEFEYYKMGRGLKIKISSRAVNKEFALLHEIGHFIDNQAFGAKGVNESEVAGGALGDVLKVLKKTNAIESLTNMKKTGRYELRGRMRKLLEKDFIDVDYFLRPEEQWARAYSQYIAAKSGNEMLVKQLSWQIKSDDKFPIQWQEKDFKNTIFAIDKFLLYLKWLKQI